MTGRALTQTVAENIRTAMLRKGFNPTSLARQAGMARTTLVLRLDGHEPFNVDQIEKVTAVLGINPPQSVFAEVAK
jgi:hypothetical protein